MKTKEEVINEVEITSNELDTYINRFIGDDLVDIELFMQKVKTTLMSDNVPDMLLNKIALQLPTHLYYLTTVKHRLELKRGVSAEMSKLSESSLLLSMETGTVQQKQSYAYKNSENERIIALAYKSASTLVQSKIDGALEILACVKRIQQLRMEEMKLTRMASDSI